MNEKELQQLRAENAKKADDVARVKKEAVQTQSIEEQSPYPGWTPALVMSLSFSILIFGLLVMLLISRLAVKGTDLNALMRVFGLILIIVAAIFLVVAGYTQEQIAPVIGLLGTIAGYLLGTNRRRKDEQEVSNTAKTNPNDA